MSFSVYEFMSFSVYEFISFSVYEFWTCNLLSCKDKNKKAIT